MATQPFAPPQLPTFFGQNFGPTTPVPPVLLGAQQLTANASAFASIFLQPVNSLWLYLNIVGFSGSDQARIRFNNDSGANYWWRNITVAVAATAVADTATSTTTGILFGAAGTTATQVFATIGNPSTTAAVTKVLRASVLSGAGSASAPTVSIFSGGEWNNTATPINRIDVACSGANNFLAGSSIMVFGGL